MEGSHIYVILPMSPTIKKQSLRSCQLLCAVKYYYACGEDKLGNI